MTYETFEFCTAAAASYLLGSIPFGYLVGRARGVDVRKIGSGNIGATNVFRSLGKGLGILTFALDVAKGVVAAAVVPNLVLNVLSWPTSFQLAWYQRIFPPFFDPPLAVRVACGAAALLGHAFPCFLDFKGGKGVATGLGLAIALVPRSAALGLAVWIPLFLATRYVSVGSVCAALAVAVAPWLLDRPADGGTAWNLVCGALSVLALFVVWKHRSNLVRLARGTENRFCFTKKQRAARDARKKEWNA